jgi:hypothetical protein
MTSIWETLHTFREIGCKVKETNGGFGDGAVWDTDVKHFTILRILNSPDQTLSDTFEESESPFRFRTLEWFHLSKR